MSESAHKSLKSNVVNSVSKLALKKHLKLPRIHRVRNQFQERSISHHPTSLNTSETAKKIKERKSPDGLYPRSSNKIIPSSSRYYSSPDEGISKLQTLTVRNSSAHNELLSLQERMLEVKLKSMINPKKIQLEDLESSLYDGIEKCFADSKKSVDKLMNKYASFSIRRPFAASPI